MAKNIDEKQNEHERDRYIFRILKGMALPLLYVFVSVLMLRNYVSEFTNYYEYNMLMIAAGFGIGAVCMAGLTIYNVYRADKNSGKAVKINRNITIAIYGPIIAGILIIAVVFGISTVWQFSIGFFASAVIPPVVVLIAETTRKGKLFTMEKGTKKLYMIMVPSKAE